MSNRIGWVAVCLVVTALVIFSYAGAQHLRADHTQLHFDAQLLEVVRQKLIEMHPQLGQPTEPAPVFLGPAEVPTEDAP